MNKKSITIVVLIATFIVGWYLRFEDTWVRRQIPDMFYMNNEPVLLNSDGYYYLSLAKDLHSGNYTEHHQRRLFPDQPANPKPAPLISRITAWLHAITGASFERLGMILPALFGPLLALAVFGIATELGCSRGASCAAALLSVISIEYVERTKIGFFDTDFLNVTFAASAAGLGLRLHKTAMSKWVLVLVAVNLLLFLAWWHMAMPVVLLLCIGPLVPALLQLRQDRNRIQHLGVFAFASLLCLALIWGIFGPGLIMDQTVDLFRFLRQSDPVFPQMAGYLTELKATNLIDTGAKTAGHWTVFVTSILGFGLLAKNHRVRILSLLPLFVIACLSFAIGARFLIFFAPITALGLSYIGHLSVQRFLHSATPQFVAGLLGIALLSVPAFQKATTETTRPVTVDVNPAVQAVSPLPEGLVWASWTLGYPLLFHSAHRIIGDAQSLSGERMVYNFLPLATSNQRFAVNFIHFYSKHGFNGMRAFYERVGDTEKGFSLLCAILHNTRDEARRELAGNKTWSSLYPDLEDALEFLFPSLPFPIYLALPRHMLASTDWYRFGSWSPDEAEEEIVGVFLKSLSEEEGHAVQSGFRINLQEGGRFGIDVDGELRPYQVSHILTHDGRSLKERRVAEGELRFEWIPMFRFGALLTPNIAGSVFNKLYLRHAPVPDLFEPLALESPSHQIWRVKPQHR